MIPRFHRWEELTALDLRGLDPERAIALLPVSATEQHGPHLPLGTDAIILDGVLERVRAHVEGRVLALCLPHQRTGNSLEHTDFPGTLHAEPATLLEHWKELALGARRAGIRKLAIINSHGGQPQLVDLLAQELRARHRMLVARVQTFRLGIPAGLFADDELRHGFHGGELETSMMLALRPDLVRMNLARDLDSRGRQMAQRNRLLHPEGAAGLAWQAQDLNESGVVGDAASADAARGEKALGHVAERLADVLLDLDSLPLSTIDGEPEP